MGHCFVERRLNVANFFTKLPSLLLIFLLAFNLSSLIQLCSCRSIESTPINAAADSSSSTTEVSSTTSPLPPSPSTISSAVLRARNKNSGGSTVIFDPIVASSVPTPLKSGTGELLGHEKRFSNGHQIVAEVLSESLSSTVSSTLPPSPTVDNKVQSEVIASVATPSAASPTKETVVVVVLTNNNDTSGQSENVDGEC